MREEIKCKVEYFGPNNLDNKVYIRKKNANLIRFSDAICHISPYFFPLCYLMPKDMQLRSFLVYPVPTIEMYWPETSPERLFDNMLRQIEAFEFLDIPHGWIHQYGRINEKVVKTVKNPFIGCKSLEEIMIKKDLINA